MADSYSNKNEQLLTEYKRTNSNEVRNNIITSNIRLVHKMVNRCYRDSIDPSYNREDLVADGVLGLIEAIEKFDLSLKLQFSTYANWWIFKFVSANFKMGTLGLPSHRIKIYKQFNVILEAAQESGEHLSETEVLKKMGVSQKIFVDTMSQKDTISIDSIVADNGASTTDRNMYIVSREANEDKIIERMDFEIIRNQMDKILSEKEIQILLMRYGIGIDKPMTLQQVAKALGISYEYVRLLQKRAETKMREHLT